MSARIGARALLVLSLLIGAAGARSDASEVGVCAMVTVTGPVVGTKEVSKCDILTTDRARDRTCGGVPPAQVTFCYYVEMPHP